MANKQIAAALGISGHTVSTHIRRMFSKCGVHSRAQIASLRLSHERVTTKQSI